MSEFERPDLSEVPDEVVAYIEALERRVEGTKGQARGREQAADDSSEMAEPPTTIQVITATVTGVAKRTARHHYSRQRRGGMGVFDLQASTEVPPGLLGVADESDELLAITSHGRVFRRQVRVIRETQEPRGRGELMAPPIPFRVGEVLVALLPAKADGFCVLLSERGFVRRVRASYLGRSMIDGTSFHVVKEGGYLVSARWSAGDADLFIGTRQGLGIRFNEAQVPARGVLGLRVAPEDQAVGLAPVAEQGGVFLLGADGRGTIRLMAGFRANKTPGAGGKVAMKTDSLVAVLPVLEEDDLLLLSRLSKIIRFSAAEVPAKEGVVQGVNCFSLRADEVVAAANASLA